ncbi:hypothetical protein HPB47_023306 [Ixodes persulcatus]|uniref:Uncharacterized protein n=1 Tax=Ixodes persulcatus TaxID=34615 RepID=A0AC60Q7C1_IXOPE|nr:hypothetical protein HPB47_023306 [Ixodes persulcatus]
MVASRGRPFACLCAGKPSLDPDHPEFVPTVFAHKAPAKRSLVARYARATKRKIGDRTNETLPLSVDPGGSAETGNEGKWSETARDFCPLVSERIKEFFNLDSFCAINHLSHPGRVPIMRIVTRPAVKAHATKTHSLLIPPAARKPATKVNGLRRLECAASLLLELIEEFFNFDSFSADQSPLLPGTCPGDAHCDTPSGEGAYDEEPQFKAVQKRVQNLEAEVLRLQKDVDILKAKPAEPVVPPTKPGQETRTCWGGRASDKKLIQSSGSLDKLADGDVILADRGFLIKEDVARRDARLVVPALTRGKKQLPARGAEEARQIS